MVMTVPSRSITLDGFGEELACYARRCGRQLALEDAFERLPQPDLTDLVVLAERYLAAVIEEPPHDLKRTALSPRQNPMVWTHEFIDGYLSLLPACAAATA